MFITEEQTRTLRRASEFAVLHRKEHAEGLICFIRGGIPQVILPQWFDTYDCASRVEWLGIGLHGSRSVAPKINDSELGSALLRVLKDKWIQTQARVIGDLCKTTEGREVAHDQIVQYALKDE
jgi:UDP:flavonoid glycosyltransferase YjiC (YdhE family)